MRPKYKLAYSLIESIFMTLKAEDYSPEIVDKPCGGGLLVVKCVRVKDKTLSISTNLEFEVYDENDGSFETFDLDKLDKAIDHLIS